MSRLDEVEAKIDDLLRIQSDWTPLTRTLSAEVDARDEVITKILALLKPKGEAMKYMLGDQKVDHHPTTRLYARALTIAEGRDNG